MKIRHCVWSVVQQNNYLKHIETDLGKNDDPCNLTFCCSIFRGDPCNQIILLTVNETFAHVHKYTPVWLFQDLLFSLIVSSEVHFGLNIDSWKILTLTYLDIGVNL